MSEEALARDRGPVDTIWGNRPFMLLWSAQAISQTAQNAIWFALLVLIEEATHSTTQIGIAMVSFILPSVIFTVPAGVMVDRIDKRLVLVSTNWLRALAVLGYIFFNQSLSLVYAVTFVFSVISQFFLPAEAAMIPTLVGKQKLITANSLFNLTFTMSQLAGMVLIAPIVIKFFGVNTLFVAIAAMFALCGFLVLTLPPGKGVQTGAAEDGGRAIARFFGDLRDTWDFVVSDKAATMAMVILTSGATLTLVTAMLAPRFMVAVVGIRADDTVYLLAPAGVGMAVGAVVIGRLTRWVSKELLIVAGMFGVGMGLLLLSIVTPIWDFIFRVLLAILVDPEKLPHVVSLVSVVMVIAAVMGLALSMVIISSQTILQEQTPVASRGRIFAVQIMLGNLASILPLVFVGELADLLGVSRVLIVLAVVMFSLGSMAMRAYRFRIWGEPGSPGVSI